MTGLHALGDAWRASDALFDIIRPEALLFTAIPLRHPALFYLGHLPAFAWSQIARHNLGLGPLDPRLDDLFARGIDPHDLASAAVAGRDAWPALDQVVAYRDLTRLRIAEHIEKADPTIVALVIEHERMHHETLHYLFQELPLAAKRPPVDTAQLDLRPARRGPPVSIPAGRVRLGAPYGSVAFGWDNEFPAEDVEVPRFSLDRFPVTNSDYQEFLRETGHAAPKDWNIDQGTLRAQFAEVPLGAAGGWPVLVSHTEASAYAEWQGARLPMEAEIHRAALTTPEGYQRVYPWGDNPPGAIHGNFGGGWNPVPVGSHPGGVSAWGVEELVGNGWEWTDTPFLPRTGFEALHPSYPGYSADFFDDAHRVVYGAAWPTDPRFLRPSFRNWYLGTYPYAFTKFRLVR